MHVRRMQLAIMALLIPAQLALGQQAATDDALPSAPEGKTWKLVWHDEFDDTTLDESKWDVPPDGKRKEGWWMRKAISLDGKGHLVISTLKEGDRYIDGCVRTKGKFEHAFGYYVAHLVNRVCQAIRPANPKVGIMVCPSQDYYQEPPKPELIEFCHNIPDDVLVYWTGPRTRSRVILKEEIDEWIEKTGRKPLIWDNTIYARFQPFWDSKVYETNGYLLNAYGAKFPDNMPELVAGIHLNCNTQVIYQPAS